VIPFRIVLRPGRPLYAQIVKAAKKSIIAGQIRSGDPFPQVRELSRALKVNPSTAVEAINDLVSAGVLERRSSSQLVVAAQPRRIEKTELIRDDIEQLVSEAKKLQIPVQDVIASVAAQWPDVHQGQ